MEPYLQLLYQYVLPALITIVAGALLVFLRGLIKKFGGKLDLDSQVQLQSLIQNSVGQGVAFAEQWAKNRQKELGETMKVSSNDKLHKALEFVLADLQRSGITNVVEKTIRDKIESCLGFNTMGVNEAQAAAADALGLEGDSDEDTDFLGGSN